MRTSVQGGQALVAVLIIALVLGGICASLAILSVANATASRNSVQRAVALTMAEIGVERAKAGIADQTFEPQFAVQNHQATDSGEGHAPEVEFYGAYAVRVTENYGDTPGQYLVVSQGTSGTTTRGIRVVLRRIPPEMPDVLAAIMLYNESGLEIFRGVPPNVCGLDTDLPAGMPFSEARASDCVPGSGEGPDVVGIGVHDDQSVTDIISALGSNTERVEGTDGDDGTEPASVYNVTRENPTGQIDPMTVADIAALAEEYERVCDYVFDGLNWYTGDGHPVDEANFGTTEAPKVVVLRRPSGGVLRLRGNLTGVGLLIIDCEVEFAGTFNYAGLIVITNRGEATVSVEMMGTPLVMGGIIAANPAEDATSVLDLRGTADVFFSREGLAYAQQALVNNAKFETVFFTEKRPEADDLEIEW